jgi:hypothetical protein
LQQTYNINKSCHISIKLLILNTFAAKVYKDNGYKNLSIFLHIKHKLHLKSYQITFIFSYVI